MANNDWKDRLGIVYSTKSDFVFETEEIAEPETLPKDKQRLRVRIEKNGRKGKTVTLVSGFVGSTEDLKCLGKLLKTKLSTGGSCKDNDIIIQGDVKACVISLLKAEGYNDVR